MKKKMTSSCALVDTIGNQHFVPYSEVSLTRAFGMFPVGMVLHNWAIEHNVGAFSELSFALLAGKAKQRMLI